LLVGCAHALPNAELPLSDGARTLFAQGNFCPQVSVTARPDIQPHTLLAPGAPPNDVAADPQRLQMWRDAKAQEAAALDGWGRTFDVSGCAKTQQYICGRPLESELIAGSQTMITGDAHSLVTSDGTPQGTIVMSAVKCVPRREPSAQLDADAVPIPEQTDVPPLPAPLRALTVKAIPRALGSDLQPAKGPISPRLQTLCNESARRFGESFGWRVVDDGTADLEVIVPCIGGVDAQGNPVNVIPTLESDDAIELRWPPTDVPQMELRAEGKTVEMIPVGPSHVRCDLPRSADRLFVCQARFDQWSDARIARQLAASPALAAFANKRSH
jgi:hypothetical protein